MGKYLDIFRSVGVAGQNSNDRRRDYDINDINDKTPDREERHSTFGRLNRLCRSLQELEHRCPDYVDAADWQRAIEDGRRLLTPWGERAEALDLTSDDLFGLHTPSEKPDQMGLLWLVRNRPVVALTATEASYRCPSGAILTYRRERRA
jgi:hypothetical protein